ncbi:MAG: NUDIX domain-containing protein [Fusobacteria bacterium]|nr:NUDIX domain-containing protein [Fusobacteriota bacterium]
MNVSVGIIIKEDKVFVGRRKKDKLYPEYFEFPGGKVERFENSKEALCRELKEELKIDVVACFYLFDTVSHYKEFSVTLHLYLITEFWNDIDASGEYDEWRFQEISKIRSLKLLPGNLEMVKKLFEIGVFHD